MNISTKFRVFLLLAITLSQVNFGQATKRYSVYISNGLGNGDQLTVHCKSKDDDLGVHTLRAYEHWSWTFKVNIWKTTLYWCDINTIEHHGSFKVSAMHDDILDMCNSNECLWSARDDGLYLKDNSKDSWFLKYKWEY
ncbi:hypothetical protein PTKIN_Ptkin08bG0153800 [Pterospermum kingtungense]